MRRQMNITLTEEQMKFMAENVETMSQKQMALRFGCSQGKVYENARIAGIPFPERTHPPLSCKKRKVESEWFNVDQFSDWMFGFSKRAYL